MAYNDPGKEIEGRVSKLIEHVNDELQAHYAKSQTPKSAQISIALATGKGARARTPEEQAGFVLKGTSWTCNSAHMSDAAKHVLVREGGKVVWSMSQTQQRNPAAWGVLHKAWDDAMATEKIRNYMGGSKFANPSSDPLHLELPHSRLKDSDPRVIKALEVYAKATRLDGHRKNLSFEQVKGSKFQKNWLQNYDLKLAATKKQGP